MAPKRKLQTQNETPASTFLARIQERIEGQIRQRVRHEVRGAIRDRLCDQGQLFYGACVERPSHNSGDCNSNGDFFFDSVCVQRSCSQSIVRILAHIIQYGRQPVATVDNISSNASSNRTEIDGTTWTVEYVRSLRRLILTYSLTRSFREWRNAFQLAAPDQDEGDDGTDRRRTLLGPFSRRRRRSNNPFDGDDDPPFPDFSPPTESQPPPPSFYGFNPPPPPPPPPRRRFSRRRRRRRGEGDDTGNASAEFDVRVGRRSYRTSVYLPPSYSNSTTYPLLLSHHGLGGT